ncbi:hypothetical protein SAMN04489809_3471 [Microbacterium paraoxydans]|uniref:Uncharacterized protein n=2 Tax=Microbacterium paraoxydans TaxID=199592 RepID=A0A1H1L9V4_9MICO|nr:hypothetical protein SAMN04489809_0036 [Microbacterium paraoxydans]SDT08397.1 hypothetical protein SAMN04489809_3471 [Microbacterium paraoxydans]
MSTAVFGAPEWLASSGRAVKVGEDGTLVFDHVNGYLTPEMVPDAEEFFAARKDEELGRWRWPEDRKFVVYGRDDGGARVVDETTGDNWFYRREDVVHASDPFWAACAFWEAHPALPWAGARPGDIWVLTLNDISLPDVPAMPTTGGRFVVIGEDNGRPAFVDFSDIADARCVWSAVQA